MSDAPFRFVAIIAYFLALIAYAAHLGFRRRTLATVATALMCVGLAMQTVGVIIRWVVSGHAPFSNMHEFATVLSLAIVACYLFLLLRHRIESLGAMVAGVALGAMAAASLFPSGIESHLVPALQSYWLQIHVSLAALGEGAFAVSFVSAILYLFASRSGARESGSRLPSAETLDEVTYRAIIVGYPLFTVGAMVAGAIWAHLAWGSFWSWDPKETSSLIVWLVYTAYLHARLVRGWVGRRAAILAIVGFSMSIFTFFSNLILGGLHSYG